MRRAIAIIMFAVSILLLWQIGVNWAETQALQAGILSSIGELRSEDNFAQCQEVERYASQQLGDLRDKQKLAMGLGAVNLLLTFEFFILSFWFRKKIEEEV